MNIVVSGFGRNDQTGGPFVTFGFGITTSPDTPSAFQITFFDYRGDTTIFGKRFDVDLYDFRPDTTLEGQGIPVP